ncbi:MAG: pantoate--beta-alanine ligase [Roseiflexaceae bacterium]
MELFETIADFRQARARFDRLGLVPTMGYLHAGHLSLVRQARAECGAVAVSIFVNPTQFGPREDLSRYPRDLERDLRRLREENVDLVFVPNVAEMYPNGFSTFVDVRDVTEMLEGAARPGHFQGVATVVCKLFNIAQPTRAYFGQKDAQQTVVVRKMARELDMPLDVVVVPTTREADGLAMSSRNVYLSAEQRQAATVLNRALQTASARYAAGERDAEVLRQAMRAVLDAEPLANPEYVSVADALTLRELDQVGAAGALCSLAVRFGTTRLIDTAMLGD